MPHGNIAIFIPHLGCPNMCSFCNQRTISSTQTAPTAEEAECIIRESFGNIQDKQNYEIAFFGGSFTAIDREYMLSLLETASRYVGDNGYHGIRISTRPDCIDKEILDILKYYKVSAIELGAQSMSDKVLTANDRGHTADDVRKASEMIKSYDFELGLQMMTGLYMSGKQDELYTMNEIINLHPDTVRIYPVAILKGTKLAELYESGEYRTMSLNECVELCAHMLECFEQNGIKVIRLGLHASDNVADSCVGGLYHPAMRELCESFLLRNKIDKLLDKTGSYEIYVNPRNVSKVVGQKKSNLEYFRNKGYSIKVIQDKELSETDIRVSAI